MITIYTKDWCGSCTRAKNYFIENDIEYEEINIDEDSSALDFMKAEGHKTVPQIYYNDKLFLSGGYSTLKTLEKWEIHERIKNSEK
jgi:glutaredoxin